MCFSAEMSFGAAAVLMTSGAVSLKLNPDKSQRMFAALPLLFGIQQASEGLIWLSLGQNSSWPLQQIGLIGFLGFALVIWPSWVPWSLFKMEKEKIRRKILQIFGVIGLMVSVITAWFLLARPPTPYIVGQCMNYATDVRTGAPPNLEFLAYMAPVVFSFFVSSKREARITGALILAGLGLAHLINRQAVTSVWCFFAGVASFYIVWAMFKGSEYAASSVAPARKL